jgi:hypothetical protein
MDFPMIPQGVRITKKFAEVKVKAEPVPPKRGRLDVPLHTETDWVQATSGPCAAVPQISYIPGPGQPNVLSQCTPSTPGCFDTVPASGQSFNLFADTEQYGTLSINFPISTPDSFAADFLVRLVAVTACGDIAAGDTFGQSSIRIAPQRMCDVNQDGQVDSDDIGSVMAAIDSTPDPGSPFDPTGDGKVTVADARACALQCTKPNCAK